MNVSTLPRCIMINNKSIAKIIVKKILTFKRYSKSRSLVYFAIQINTTT